MTDTPSTDNATPKTPTPRAPKPGETWTYTGVVEGTVISVTPVLTPGPFTKMEFVAEAPTVGSMIQVLGGKYVRVTGDVGADGSVNKYWARNYRVVSEAEAAAIEAEFAEAAARAAAAAKAKRLAAFEEDATIDEVVALLCRLQAKAKKE